MEFLIDGVQQEDGLYHITGICSSDSEPIKIGDQFSKIYKKNLQMTPEGNYEISGREDVRDINLSVNEIKAYRHSLDELPAGMSGELVLAGQEGIILRKAETLGVN
jgi:hypothetical protein